MYGYNENRSQKSWTQSNKVYGNMYIDDAAFGCPLIHPEDGSRPYVDWKPFYEEISGESIETLYETVSN